MVEQNSDNIPNHTELYNNRLIAIVSIVGGVLYGCGFGVTLDVFPGSGFFIGFVVYVFTAVGAILVSLTGLVAVWLAVRDSNRVLTEAEATATALVAPIIATGLMTAIPNTYLLWTFLGQNVLSLAFLAGFSTSRSRRFHVLSVGAIAVASLVASLMLWTRDVTSPGSLLFVSGSGALLFLLFGGPFFLLGNHLTIPQDGSSPE